MHTHRCLRLSSYHYHAMLCKHVHTYMHTHLTNLDISPCPVATIMLCVCTHVHTYMHTHLANLDISPCPVVTIMLCVCTHVHTYMHTHLTNLDICPCLVVMLCVCTHVHTSQGRPERCLCQTAYHTYTYTHAYTPHKSRYQPLSGCLVMCQTRT
jgi:hypothetical protein